MALGDGRVIQAGRVVVKNVAGYDLPKLFVGSQGTLGLMADATLKLYPLPRHRQSLTLPVETLAMGLELVKAMASELRINTGALIVPAAQVGVDPVTPYMLVVTAEGIAEDVASEIAAVQERIATVSCHEPTIVAQSATEQWQQLLGLSTKDEIVVRIGLPIQEIASYLLQTKAELDRAGQILIDVGNGLIYLRYVARHDADASHWLAMLRQAAQHHDGYAVAMAVPVQLVGKLDRWGHRAPVQTLMTQLQQQWDPRGIFSHST